MDPPTRALPPMQFRVSPISAPVAAPDSASRTSDQPRADARKVFVRSFGCQMNAHDAERMKDALAGDGYVETSEPESADLVILNTCHIRERATEKVFSELGKFRELKDDRAIVLLEMKAGDAQI